VTEAAVLLRFYGAVWDAFSVPEPAPHDIELLAEARRDMAENIASVRLPGDPPPVSGVATPNGTAKANESTLTHLPQPQHVL
jgi:hypothetical protein